MADFEPSPRAAKKRKIAVDEPTLIYSRALRTVKQAVYGKPSRSKNSNGDFEQKVRTPTKAINVVTGVRHRDHVNSPVYPMVEGCPTEDVLPQENGPTRTPHSRITDGSREQKESNTGHNGKGSLEDTEEVPTLSKKKGGNKYKGWVYIEDKEDMTRDDTPGEIKNLNDQVGRVKRGRDDLTIDINLYQLQPRNSLDTTNGARVETESVDGPLSGRARRTSRRVETKKGERANVEPVGISGIQRSDGHPKKKPTNNEVSSDVPLHEAKGVGKLALEEVSSDELAQEYSGDGSKQEGWTETPPRKTQRQKRIFNQTPVEDEPVSVVESSEPIRHTELDSHAQALQRMLHESPETLTALKTHLLSGLTGNRRLPLVNVDDEVVKVKQLVEQTILAGEGNSMLLIGSRGSGKTSLVETVLSDLASDHREAFYVVRLNGFIHTDDKLALREIWRQLGREMDVENDDLGGRNNYADTLTSLLALLAHPATEEDESATARSVVFILDEFDLFASHPRQTLLYNLFDVAQSRNAPIAVLGLTTKVNVVDILEKRVKSRFAQRYVHLSLPKNFRAFQDVCFSALSYRPSTHDSLQHNKIDLQGLSAAWIDYLINLFKTPLFQQLLQTLYTSSKSVSAFMNAALLPISAMSSTTIPTAKSFGSHTLHPPDSKIALMSSLSTLALSLLIAAARLDIILDADVCTFGMAYEEYVALASKSKMQTSAAGQMAIGGGARIWSKELAKGAWEHLGKLELVLPAVGGNRGAGKGEMWRVDVGLEEIGGVLESEGGRGGPLGRWCREI